MTDATSSYRQVESAGKTDAPTSSTPPSEPVGATAVLRISVTDLVTGDSQTTEIPAGEYVVLTTEPCHVAGTQAYPAKGTHVLTIKGRTAP